MAAEDSPKLRRKRGLKLARTRARKSIQDVAAFVGRSRQAVSAWERLDEAAPFPDDGDLKKLSVLFEISFDQLQTGAWISRYVPGDEEQDVAPLHDDQGWSTTPLPRHQRNLPLAVREYLAELRLRLTKGGASDEEIDEAFELLRSPQVFSFFSGGKLNEFNETDVLDGMKSIAEDVVVPRLRKLGRKL